MTELYNLIFLFHFQARSHLPTSLSTACGSWQGCVRARAEEGWWRTPGNVTTLHPWTAPHRTARERTPTASTDSWIRSLSIPKNVILTDRDLHTKLSLEKVKNFVRFCWKPLFQMGHFDHVTFGGSKVKCRSNCEDQVNSVLVTSSAYPNKGVFVKSSYVLISFSVSSILIFDERFTLINERPLRISRYR